MKIYCSRSFLCAFAVVALLSGCKAGNQVATESPTPPTQRPSDLQTPMATMTPNVGPTAATPGVVASSSMTPTAGATPGMTASPGTEGANTNANVPMVEGVQVTIAKPGTGAALKKGETGAFHYTGWLENFESAKQFDTSRGKKPFEVKVGAGEVIPGWDQGLIGMQEGEVRRLVISPEMGYGAQGAGGVIPPNATLYFEVERLMPSAQQ